MVIIARNGRYAARLRIGGQTLVAIGRSRPDAVIRLIALIGAHID
jgi:hypothetical protein